MAIEGTPVDETELATQLCTHGLIRTIADRGNRRLEDNRSALIETLATILNATDAPPIDLHIEEALTELEGPRFFFVQHVLCDLIPLLNVDLDVLLVFITRLLDTGGNGLDTGALSIAFGEWATKDAARSSKVYEAARTGDNLALRQLCTVLQMNGDVDEGLIFAQAHQQEAKLAAISALGAMELGERYHEVSDALFQGASSDDAGVALRSLEAAYRAAAKRKVCAPASFDERLERIIQTHSSSAIHLAADLLWRYREGLTESAIDLCLYTVANVDPGNTGTISHIDHASYQLVRDGRAEQVIRLLAELLDRSEERITLDAFQSTYHALTNAGSDMLGNAIVYWLLNGGVYTRKCVANKVCSVGYDGPPFSIPKSSLPTGSSDQLFLCRKAVGWFFIDPLAAVAIPLAVLRDGCPDIASDVLSLIYDPLLLSYGGKLKDYLERYVEDGGANGSGITELLARRAAFNDAMEGIESLVELHPSEMQRETERVQWNEQMEKGMEQGERESIFGDLFTKQYILYGRSSLTPIHTGEGATRLTENEMKSFSISSELPLLNIVDPIGLDHLLIHLKLEPREQR
ncbi:hypothetical protein [Vreelandella boliviensis]|uniref:Uncharacterized protein n=1 Tax=Vreelandella boliviensis LC1 TaxID=1072583 RepID=A0A265E2Y5_9GAMM|nr:hypothetical protein [Halomonas boliviensis]EHJ93520.1 hypothetical protein KUC_0467 [Halomonas boliviensis LC1]OZT75954.1 hypothetical protein CE457_01660 [Halomonas boliviensis LC1]